ncbi:MAG: hypothetical protein MH132_02250 [Hydrotalea sp.]|nr:hypothetical protein [Hydrotalea sp.]
MKFYRINISFNKKVVGVYPQIETGVYPIMDNNPTFIGNNYFKKINFQPELAIPILKNKAKKTDLIGVGIMGFTNALLISERLKIVLEKYVEDNVQFFQAPIIFKGLQESGYWIVHPYKSEINYIDFKKSTFYRTSVFGSEPNKQIEIKDATEFEKMMQLAKESNGISWAYKIDKLVLNTNDTSFFVLRNVSGGVGYFISEKVKEEIESAGCTGIEFELISQD